MYSMAPAYVPAQIPTPEPAFVHAAPKSYDLLILHVCRLSYLLRFDGWIPSKPGPYVPAMFRQVCHIGKHVPVLFLTMGPTAAADVKPWVGSGQACTPMAVFFLKGASAKCDNMYTTAIYMRQNREMHPHVSSAPFHPKQAFPRIQYQYICSTLEALIPTYVVDGLHVEHLKDARRANVEPNDAQAKWQHALPNSKNFGM